MFVDKRPVPVTVGENTIFIRPKMDYGTKNKVVGAAAQVTTKGEAEVDVGAYQTALLVHNVVRWSGPAFVDDQGKPIPCTPANIEALDPDEPLLEMVLEEIAQRNLQGGTDPNSEAAGSSGSQAPAKKRRGSST